MNTIDPLANWRKRLAGEPVPTSEGHPEPGYYRLRKKWNHTNEHWWTAAAYFTGEGGQLIGVLGDRDMTPHEIGDLWTYLCQYPIPDDLYFKFEDRWEVPDEEWPRGLIGEPKRPKWGRPPLDPLERIIGRNHNAPPEVLPHIEHAEAIDAAIGATLKHVTNSVEAAVALGSKNRIAELRLQAEKAGKSRYEPLYRAYKQEQEKWAPIITRAATAEREIHTEITRWRESERQRLLKEAAEAEARQRQADEAAERAAQRSIARGEPEAAPVVEQKPAPTPALEPIKPTHGTRGLKEQMKRFAEIDDYDQVYQHFKDKADLKAFLQAMAQNAVTAGQTVPGTHVREGLI